MDIILGCRNMQVLDKKTRQGTVSIFYIVYDQHENL
uniref:Uncharacterized protein n=1 Tax=Arundo donax TaxID=35708 RepID=A0A0A9AWK1_ARUDO